VIRLRRVVKQFRDGGVPHTVLDGVDLDVAAGELVTVVGASGSGKSTLLYLVGALDADFEGQASVDGEDLRALSADGRAAFRSRSVGFVFQSFNLLPALSALDNVTLPAFFRERGGGGEGVRAVAAVAGQAALARVGLADKAGKRPAQLSGGERQRVALARALFARPRVLLADEPTGNLDAGSGAAVIELFRDLAASGLAVLVVTHEERVTRVATRALRLEGGRLQ
jgi:putative ABC transport system ATP-binding protein